MRLTPAVLAAVLLFGCAPDEAEPPAELPAAEQAAPAPSVTLADLAGTWQNTATFEGVADPVVSTMTGSADGNWTLSLEGRPAVPLTMTVQGDSVIGQSAEYESVLRPGVMVTVRTASVLQDGELVGHVMATYRTPNGEEMSHGALRATRMQ